MDINSSGTFDAQACENIPLHYTNLIQAYGFLLVTDLSMNVIQISDNLTSRFSLQSEQLLGHALHEFLGETQYAELCLKLENKQVQDNIPLNLNFSFGASTVELVVLLHVKEAYIILELEEVIQEKLQNFTYLYQEIRYISAILKVTGSVEELCSKAAQTLKNISGFDRVMLYKFDEEWNGKVLGEAKEADMDSYMDLHFPSSDIPKQARQLYLKNAYRLIPDIHYKPSALIPSVHPETNAHTNLSECNLRSVAQVHLEYLNNMGVRASMSVPIIHDRQLWGIVACHHKTARSVSYELRSAFELLSNILSEQIAAREVQAILEKKIRLSSMLGKMIQQMANHADFVDGLTADSTDFLRLLNINGASILYEGHYQTIGEVPDRVFVDGLMNWYNQSSNGKLYYTSKLPGEYEPATTFADISSGVIILPISADRNYYIIGFRKEYIRSITWAGDPDHARGLTGDIRNLHPRNSFRLFQNEYKFQSEKWDYVEIEMAESLLKAVLEVILKSQILKRIIAEEEAYQLSFIAQKTSNVVFTLNQNGQLEWVNEAFQLLSGKEPQALIGKELREVLAPADGVLRDIKEWLTDKDESFSREMMITKQEKEFHLNVNFSKIEDNNTHTKVIAIGTDVTAIKEKTSQLEEVNRHLDEYAYIVSHDLKTPLKGIEGLMDILSEDLNSSLEEEHKEMIRLIRLSLARMNTFISNILSKAQGTSGSERVNLNSMLSEMLQWMSISANHITFRIQENLPQVYTDKISLMQVLGNLLSNAVRYGTIGNPAPVIEVGMTPLSNGLIEWYVKDNGKGIPGAYHSKIFELFDTGKESGSTGIGLSTVKSLVEEHDGRIWLESDTDQGAAFYFTWKADTAV